MIRVEGGRLIVAFPVRPRLHIAIFVHSVGIAIGGPIADAVEAIDLNGSFATTHVPGGLKVEHPIMVYAAPWEGTEAATPKDKDGMIADTPEKPEFPIPRGAVARIVWAGCYENGCRTSLAQSD